MSKTSFPVNWDLLVKWKQKISILVNNPLPEHKGEGKESYKGIVTGIKDGFLFLDTPENTRIEAIIIKIDMILSMWIYR